MKKFVCILIIGFIVGQTISAQDKLLDIMSELKQFDNVKVETVDRSMIEAQMRQEFDKMTLDPQFPDTISIEEMEKNFEKLMDMFVLEIVTVKDASDDVFQKICASIEDLRNDNNYEFLFDTKKKDSNHYSIYHKEGDTINNMYAITLDKNQEIVFIRREGGFSKKDITSTNLDIDPVERTISFSWKFENDKEKKRKF